MLMMPGMMRVFVGSGDNGESNNRTYHLPMSAFLSIVAFHCVPVPVISFIRPTVRDLCDVYLFIIGSHAIRKGPQTLTHLSAFATATKRSHSASPLIL